MHVVHACVLARPPLCSALQHQASTAPLQAPLLRMPGTLPFFLPASEPFHVVSRSACSGCVGLLGVRRSDAAGGAASWVPGTYAENKKKSGLGSWVVRGQVVAAPGDRVNAAWPVFLFLLPGHGNVLLGSLHPANKRLGVPEGCVPSFPFQACQSAPTV